MECWGGGGKDTGVPNYEPVLTELENAYSVAEHSHREIHKVASNQFASSQLHEHQTWMCGETRKGEKSKWEDKCEGSLNEKENKLNTYQL